MEITGLLTDAFERVRARVHEVTDGLDAAALAWRPDPGANSVAWLVWHATRVEDDHLAEIAGREQVWLAQGWAEGFALPFEAADTGYGHRAEQVAAVQPGPELLAGYHDAVAAQTVADLAGLDPAALDRIIDERWDPPVSVGVRLVSVINDVTQHVGQAAYVRGMLERR